MDKPTQKFVPKSVHLLDQMREVLLLHHHNTRSEEVYSYQIIGAHGAPYVYS